MTFYDTRDEAIEATIRKPLAGAANRDKVTETMIENIAGRLIQPVVQPDPRGMFVARSVDGLDMSPDRLWDMFAAYGPSTRTHDWKLIDGGTNLNETREFFLIVDALDPIEEPVDIIEVDASEDAAPYFAALTKAGWEPVTPAKPGAAFATDMLVQRIEVA